MKNALFLSVCFCALSLSVAFAEAPKKQVINYGEHALACFPQTLKCKALDRKGAVVVTLEAVYYEHYHPFEIHGDEVFWITRVGDDNTNPNWEDQLLVKKLNSGRPEMLFHYQGLDFRASPDGNNVIFREQRNLLLLDRRQKAFTTIVSNGPEDGFSLLQWSKDNTMFWFGEGVVGGWRKLGLYKDGKITWFPNTGGTLGGAFEPDRGWLVTSDAPLIFDTESMAEFKKSKTTTHLTLVDVFSGKRLAIAEGPTNYFKPKWSSADVLEYSLDGERQQITADEIKQKLKEQD